MLGSGLTRSDPNPNLNPSPSPSPSPNPNPNQVEPKLDEAKATVLLGRLNQMSIAQNEW